MAKATRGTEGAKKGVKVAKKTAAKKTPAKKAVVKHAAAKHAAAKKVPVKKAAAKKVPVKKVPVKKAAAKKVPVKKAPVKKAAAKKVPVKKAVARKPPVKQAPVKKAVAKKAPVKKATVEKATVEKAPASAGRPVLKTVGARLSTIPVRPRKHSGPALAASTMDRLEELLEEERDRHLRQAEELQAEADALVTEREQGDTQFDEESGEGDTVSVERERDLALSATARQTMEEIETALSRMSTGEYGYCELCGDRIPVARLDLIPWANLCVKCKSRGERRR